MEDTKITVEQLLAKIGQLVIQLEIAQGRVEALVRENEELRSAPTEGSEK